MKLYTRQGQSLLILHKLFIFLILLINATCEEPSLFLEGRYEDYLLLVQDQPKEKRLEWTQFQEIQELGKRYRHLLNNKELKVILGMLQMDIKEMFIQLKAKASLDKEADLFEAAFFVHISLTTPTRESYENFKRIKKACFRLKTETAEEALSYYMKSLAHALDLDIDSPVSQYLLQEALKKHIYCKEDLKSLTLSR